MGTPEIKNTKFLLATSLDIDQQYYMHRAHGYQKGQ